MCLNIINLHIGAKKTKTLILEHTRINNITSNLVGDKVIIYSFNDPLQLAITHKSPSSQLFYTFYNSHIGVIT